MLLIDTLKLKGNTISAKLPPLGNKDNYIDKNISQHRETCLWIPTSEIDDSKISSFVMAAKKRGYGEEESLNILMKNQFNTTEGFKSLSIKEKREYLLDKNPVEISNQFCKIIIGNRRFGRNRRRCFNKIHAEFPQYSMADILDFYMRNKLKIKRKIAKYKRQIRKLNSLPTEEEYEKRINSIAMDYQIINEESIENFDDDNDDDCVIVSVSYEINSGWTEKDYQLLYHGLSDYGYNYARLAAVLGTKTSSMIEQFIKQQQLV